MNFVGTLKRRVAAVSLSLAVVAALPWATGRVASVAWADGPTASAVDAGRGAGATAARAPAAAATGAQLAMVDELKSEAFKALRAGQFDRTDELLGKAASLSNDPSLVQMARWTNQFEAQRREFVAERRKQYEKAVGDVHTLVKAGMEQYAVDIAARAYLLADNKDGFRQEPWVNDLIARTVAMADQFEQGEQWVKALRLYSDLGSVEPGNPLWKEKLKAATRRVRLLAIYTPEELRSMQESEVKARDAADALIRPEADRKTPATRPSDEQNDAFKIDWRETLKNVAPDMLAESVEEAFRNYYRDTNYRDMTLGGLKGIRAILTTRGLERAFPGLADGQKRAAFLADLDVWADRTRAADHRSKTTFRRPFGELLQASAKVGLPREVFVSEFADGAFAELDPFSSMIWPADLEEFNKTTQGEFSGVGIQIQLDDDGSLKVVSPLEDSPAYKAGIKAGDFVTHIDGKSAKGINLNQAVKTITGPSGTLVRLTVRSEAGDSKDYLIRRETIKVASLKGYRHMPGGGWDYFIDSENRIAYLRLTSFTKTTGEELDRAIDEMAQIGARGVILDLRYNPGGLLSAATEVVDKFLRDGVIVSTRPDRQTPNNATVATARAGDGESELPLVVLVNQYSASASEIVSGALKDHHRAIVVGERTFGKGSVQMLFPLLDRTAYLKLTTSHYYLPSGRCIHREENSTEWGVDPDVTVEMTPEQMRAAIDARQELDVLRDANSAPAEGRLEKLDDKATAVEKAVDKATPGGLNPTTKPTRKGLLESDPQLSAALLMLRLELSGAEL